MWGEGGSFSAWLKTMSRKARESRAKGTYCSYVTERKTMRNTADRVFSQAEPSPHSTVPAAMCGIIGEMDGRKAVDRGRFEALRDILAHRGPDGAGLWLSDGGGAALGHRRLSLVDLTDAGRQPMCNEDGSLWLVFNGEIYNHRVLRAELIGLGHRFSSATDSEVLLHGWEEWGSAVLPRLKGMFALGIYDARSRSLFLARDRFGIKPLYYCGRPDFFLFASELKAIAAHPRAARNLDVTALCDYFVCRYVPSPKTIWKGVKKLPPGSWLSVSADFEVKTGKWYEPAAGTRRLPEREAVEAVDALLARSVAEHSAADVPVGSFLSGGYDSSALLAYRKRAGEEPRAFTIGFDGWEKSEHIAARMVADHLKVPLETEILHPESLELLPRLARVYDEPLADISTIPTFAVSRLAARSVKAVVSGEGADEIFGGYGWHRSIRRDFESLGALGRAALSWTPLRRAWFCSRYAGAMSMGRFDRASLKKLLTPDLSRDIPYDSDWFYRASFRNEPGVVKNVQLLDIRAFMGELVLTKVDRAGMAQSLEIRVPYLDHELADFVLSLDESVYFSEEAPKRLLRENIKAWLPPRILARPKQGFVGPDSFYADDGLFRRHLAEAAVVRDGLVRREALSDLLYARDSWRLWKALVFELWYREWVAA